MLRTKKKSNLPKPTFLEGTPGRYLVRDAPPIIPSTVTPVLHRRTTKASKKLQKSKSLESRSRVSLSPESYGPSVSHKDSKVNRFDSFLVAQPSAYYNIVESRYSNQPRSFSTGYESEMERNEITDEMTLPKGWSVAWTGDGYKYYIDHNSQSCHWIHPYEKEVLPEGWNKMLHPQLGVYYYNDFTNGSQYEHPGLVRTANVVAGSAPNLEASRHSLLMTVEKEKRTNMNSMSSPQLNDTVVCAIKQSNQTQSDPLSQRLNFINQDIPEWLRVYSKASHHTDHLLKWDLFQLPQLESFDELLLKLYKQNVIDIVIDYERYRFALIAEIERRRRQNRQNVNNNNRQRPQHQSIAISLSSDHLSPIVTQQTTNRQVRSVSASVVLNSNSDEDLIEMTRF